MSSTLTLSELYRCTPLYLLAEHLKSLRTCGLETVVYGDSAVPCDLAQLAAGYVLRQRQRDAPSISARLRDAAQCDPPTQPDGSTNLASWVGPLTPEWQAVFGCGAGDRWFCHLPRDDQRTALLLVAEILDEKEMSHGT